MERKSNEEEGDKDELEKGEQECSVECVKTTLRVPFSTVESLTLRGQGGGGAVIYIQSMS